MRCCSCFSKNQLESASLLLAVWLAPNTVVIPTCSRQVCHSSVCHPVFLNDSQNLSRLFHCLVINVRLLSILATAIIEKHVYLALSTTFLFYFFASGIVFNAFFIVPCRQLDYNIIITQECQLFFSCFLHLYSKYRFTLRSCCMILSQYSA